MAAPLVVGRTSKRWVERAAYQLLFFLVGFWIVAAFTLVYHAMNEKSLVLRQRVAPPPKQPHDLLRAKVSMAQREKVTQVLVREGEHGVGKPMREVASPMRGGLNNKPMFETPEIINVRTNSSLVLKASSTQKPMLERHVTNKARSDSSLLGESSTQKTLLERHVNNKVRTDVSLVDGSTTEKPVLESQRTTEVMQNSSLVEPNSTQKLVLEGNTRNLEKFMSPLIIFTCKRADYLKETMTRVLEYVPKACLMGCPIIVSQDGYSEDVANVIRDFRQRFNGTVPIVHIQHEPAEVTGSPWVQGYKKLARHYRWALNQTFGGISGYEYPRPDRVVILEEDLRISPDFFDYFAYTAPLLDSDSRLLTVSAFNDNGEEGLVRDPTRILRSDFFPGLGWMMTRKLWDTELSSKWPLEFWDDWLREPPQRQGRHILRPEVSRTFHFGAKGGTSNNQFGDKLRTVHLNEKVVDWSVIDLSYLSESEFDRSYFVLVSKAQIVNDLTSALNLCKQRDVRIEYKSLGEYKSFATRLKIMNDEKAGIPRTAYRGVVEIRPHGDFFLFLTPPLAMLKREFHL